MDRRPSLLRHLMGMARHLVELLLEYLAHYGYWAVAGFLLLENAGLPLPGETILLLASFLAYSRRELHLPCIILVGIAAATLGDNLGYAVGHHGGRPLLERYRHVLHLPLRHIRRMERVFARYGAATILFARFVVGLRVIAGPVAGVLRMEWKRFAFFNFLGASLWVTVIALAGYLFGRHWGMLARVLDRADVVIAIVFALLAFLVWRRHKEKQTPADA
jgi:membrane protein DedA with SNARE-associated domain